MHVYSVKPGVALLLCLMLGACSSTLNKTLHKALRNEALLARNNSSVTTQTFAQQLRLDVPFFAQTDYHCGPAALASIYQWLGIDTTAEKLVPEIYLPGRKGSLQLEIVANVRSRKLLGYPLNTDLAGILAELNAGNPVLVLQNLAFAWWPQWHYSVVVGYNLDTGQMLLHSGTRENYSIGLATFDKTWLRADNWGLVIVKPTNKPINKPSNIPATATVSEYIRIANVLEQSGAIESAKNAYDAAQRHWPESSLPLIAAANLAAQTGNYTSAVTGYRKILDRQPVNAHIWNNLAWSLTKLQCYKQAQNAITKAIAAEPNNPRFQHTREAITTDVDKADDQSQTSECPSL